VGVVSRGIIRSDRQSAEELAARLAVCEGKVSGKPNDIYVCGPFRIDIRKRRLVRQNEVVTLPPKVFDLLAILVQNSERLVSKDELMDLLWPGSAVEESNLTQNIFLLRRALGETAHEHSYILTVPGSGYRFVADVRPLAESEVKQLPTYAAGRVHGKAGAIRSIGVLPFHRLTLEAGDENLSSGIADALSTKLSKIRQIRVRPVEASLKAGLRADWIMLSRQLGVDSILHGTIRRWGSRVRVTVQVIDAFDGSLLWAEKFEDDTTNILEFEDAISERVLLALEVQFTGGERSPPVQHYTDNVDAYQAYLKGRYFCNKRMPEALRKAIAYFDSAGQLDPGYSFAHLGSADCWLLLICYGVAVPQDAWPAATRALERTLEIDSGLAEAHSSLAIIRMAYERNWQGAEQECRIALAEKRDYAMAHNNYATYLTAVGRHKEAIVSAREALELEPLSINLNRDAGLFLYMSRRYTQAIGQLRHALDMDAGFAPAHWTLGLCYQAVGDHENAIHELSTAVTLFEGSTRMSADLGHAYAAAGMKREADGILDSLTALSARQYVSPYDLATMWTGLGEVRRALDCLDAACEDRPWPLVYLKVDPKFDRLRSQRRFIDLLHRIGLGELARAAS
jgi:DNA-binding winged helix-turn-helix (wHTH) protein/tetratricopeptide (TPR) repeat protein